MSRCRQRLTSMEAGVLDRQLTCAEQSKVTPLTGMPGRSMRSGRYATAQTGRFSAKARQAVSGGDSAGAEQHHPQLVLAEFHFSPSLPPLSSLISVYLSPMCISPIPLCPSSDVAFVQGSIVMAAMLAGCPIRKGGVVQGIMPLGQLAVGQALHET